MKKSLDINEICTALQELESQVRALSHWKVEAEAQLEQLSDRNAALQRQYHRLKESTDDRLQQLSNQNAALMSAQNSVQAGVGDGLEQLSDRTAALLRKFSNREHS
ncbi:MAG: hypothetical protein HQL50_00315 [Magnetococcales bacterium]|nr:hypothetical protein [Magnetococcales bacterium]